MIIMTLIIPSLRHLPCIFSCAWEPSSTYLYLCLSQLPITMSVQRTESRRKNIHTTIIRRKASADSPLVTLQSIAASVGRRYSRSLSKLDPSASGLSASASASPAPSSASNYSQDPGPANIEWDLPANHPLDDIPLNRGRKRRIRVPYTLPLFAAFTHSDILSARRNQ